MFYKILKWAVWLLPLYLAYQLTYQTRVLFSMQDTYENGESVIADVIDFRIKQIAAQTNGYVVLRFTTADGATTEQRLSLPVQLAAPIQNSAKINIRYIKDNFQNIVMTPTFRFHRNMVIVNIGVLTVSTLITFLIAIWGAGIARKRLVEPEVPNFVRTDL
ncbi:MAG TPA: hypothetical protein DCE78_08510 [Bacteroidetes bacterium]|nr:hypothetical protein [Bacteroidota bacterium]